MRRLPGLPLLLLSRRRAPLRAPLRAPPARTVLDRRPVHIPPAARSTSLTPGRLPAGGGSSTTSAVPPPGERGEAAALSAYVSAHTTPAEPAAALRELRAETEEVFRDAWKATSPGQATFLSVLASCTGARRVLELGCFTGLATVALAHAVAAQPRGRQEKGEQIRASLKIVVCDPDEKAVAIARKWTARCGLDSVVEVRHENAAETLCSLDSTDKFDMIFIDANKGDYIKYFDKILEKDLIREDGLIVVDNTLFRGLVWREDVTTPNDNGTIPADVSKGHLRAARHIALFNNHVMQDRRVVVSILPAFDGMTLIRRLPKDEAEEPSPPAYL